MGEEEEREAALKEGMKLYKQQAKMNELVGFGKEKAKDVKEAAKLERQVKKEAKEAKKSKPKKNMSAYMFYCNEHRAALVQQGLSFGDVTKQLAIQWKELLEVDKEKFQALAAEDKKRYEEEMQKFDLISSPKMKIEQE